MLIRPAETADVDALSDLAYCTCRHAYGHSMLPSDLEAHLDKNFTPACFALALQTDVLLLAIDDGRIVGLTQFGDVREGALTPDDRELRRLYVHPDFQNRGFGRALIQAALQHPEMAAAPNVFLDVWEKNHGAMRLYRRFGFEVCGSRKF